MTSASASASAIMEVVPSVDRTAVQDYIYCTILDCTWAGDSRLVQYKRVFFGSRERDLTFEASREEYLSRSRRGEGVRTSKGVSSC